jgi:hypothetical protein
VLPVQFILGGVAGGSFGEGTPDIQAQKMDWCSIGPPGLTQMRCIAPATCSHTRSYSPPIHGSAGKPGTLDRRSAPASGLRPRLFQYLTLSKPVSGSRPPAEAQALAKNSPREPSKRSKGAFEGFEGASGRCFLKRGGGRLACCRSPRANSLNHKASSAAQCCSSTGLIKLVSRATGAGVCRYKPIFVPKLGILARYEFLGAFLCLFVVGAFHIDGVRNMPLLIEEIGPIMRHVVLTPRTDEIPFDVFKHIRPAVNLILAFPAIEASETLLLGMAVRVPSLTYVNLFPPMAFSSRDRRPPLATARVADGQRCQGPLFRTSAGHR